MKTSSRVPEAAAEAVAPAPRLDLDRIRRDFPLGRYDLCIEDSELKLADYQTFLIAEAEGIEGSRLEISEDRIRGGDQAREHLGSRRAAQVQAHAQMIAVGAGK